jgi:hypothetical protein
MKIISGKVLQAPRLFVYGPPKVGKSTLVSHAKKPIFVDTNGGTNNIDVDRAPRPETLDELMATLSEIETDTTDEHRTLVLDTLDDVESLISQVTVDTYNRTAKQPVTVVGDIPYGRGPDAALEHWRRLLSKLEQIWVNRNMTIVVVDHSTVRKFKNPIEEDYERIEPKIDRKASGLIRGWCDAMLFADYKAEVATDKNKRVRAISTGERCLRTEYNPAFDAGNRYSLPKEMDLDWAKLVTGIDASLKVTP